MLTSPLYDEIVTARIRKIDENKNARRQRNSRSTLENGRFPQELIGNDLRRAVVSVQNRGAGVVRVQLRADAVLRVSAGRRHVRRGRAELFVGRVRAHRVRGVLRVHGRGVLQVRAGHDRVPAVHAAARRVLAGGPVAG